MMLDATCQQKTAPKPAETTFAGQNFLLDPSGALYWPDQRMLIVSDLHFEKGSFLASFGSMLPYYDTRETLRLLREVIQTYQPQTLLCLGDSFHDLKAMQRICPEDLNTIQQLIQSLPEWIWITGNHDAEIPAHVPGQRHDKIHLKGIDFQHEDSADSAPQMIGHYHPKITLKLYGRRITGRCFIHDETRFIMPSFGSYTGGLDIQNPAITEIISTNYQTFLLYNQRVWPINSEIS